MAVRGRAPSAGFSACSSSRSTVSWTRVPTVGKGGAPRTREAIHEDVVGVLERRGLVKRL